MCAYEYFWSVMFGVSWGVVGCEKGCVVGFFFFFLREGKRDFFVIHVHHLVRSVLII